MAKGSHENFESSLEIIKQDDKFFSRIMSKDTSMANSSSRVYYGGASGSIPFVWESMPGTPKHPFAATSIPPLTPPPSYYSTSKAKTMHKNMKPPNLLGAIFPRLTPKKGHLSPSFSMSSKASSSSSSSSSSSWSAFSLPPSTVRNSEEKRRLCLFSRSPVHHTVENVDSDDEHGTRSPTSTLCFGFKSNSSNGFGNKKNAVLSIVGRGSG